jgi:hypothetical protein
MKFTTLERFALLGLLPEKGRVLDIKAIHDLRMALAPSDAEATEINLAVGDEGMLSPDMPIARKTKDIEVGARAQTVVQNTLKTIEEKGELPESCISLWDLFFPPEAV